MANLVQTHSFLKTTPLLSSSNLYKHDALFTKSLTKTRETILIPTTQSNWRGTENGGRKLIFCTRNKRRVVCNGFLLLVDPWAPNMDSQSIASQLFAFSLFPYLGFLYFITKSNSVPRLTLFGFYFLLAFVGATIPAGIYAKVHYGTSLSNVDWLHGGAESLLTLTNLFIVLGLRDAIRKAGNENEKSSDIASEIKENEKSSI